MPKIIHGTGADDILSGTDDSEKILAGGGHDTVFAGGGNDTVEGGDGNDEIDGGAGNDDIQGGSGDDSIAGGVGADSLKGGDGFDTAVYESFPTGVSRGKGNAWLITASGATDELKQFEQVRVDVGGSSYVFALDGSNNAPLAFDDAAATDEDTPLAIAASALLANDYDFEGDPLAITGVGNAQRGAVAIDEGTITFTPASNYFGAASFDYTISDGHGGTDTGTATITVTPVNDPPVANDDTATTAEDTPVTIAVLANDSDVDNDTLNPIVVTPPEHGEATVKDDGSVTYTPAPDYFGSDSFAYKVNDGLADSNVATVAVDITPVGLVGFAQSVYGTAAPLDVLGNFAYVGDVGGAFQVFDLGDPFAPERKGVAITGQEIGDLDVVGQFAYLGNDANGFCKYEVSDPNNLTFIAGRHDGTFANGVVYDGGQYAYVGYGYTPGAELKVYDMTTFPSSPAASYNAAGDRHIYPLDAVGDRVYVMTANHGPYFEVIDVSNPPNPSFVSKIQLPTADYGEWFGHFEVVGSYAYIPTGYYSGKPTDGGLLILDLSNEGAPVVASFTQIPDAGKVDIAGAGIDVVGDRAYMASQTGLYIFDVSDRSAPEILVNPNTDADFKYPAAFLPSKGGWVEVQDDFAYVTSFKASPGAQGGLAIFQLPEVHGLGAGSEASDYLLA